MKPVQIIEVRKGKKAHRMSIAGLSQEEIIELRKALTIRRMKSDLLEHLQRTRPTLSWSTLNIAFDEPGRKTDLLDWIREEGKALLDAQVEREAAASEEMSAVAA